MTMHWNNQNNVNKNYSYIPRSTSTSSLNTRPNPYYESRLPTQVSFQRNSISRYPQTSSINSDPPEPLSYFEDRKHTRQSRSNPVPHSLSSIYTPPNTAQPKSIHATRLVTSTIIREHLITDIEQNINDIDDELSTLELQPTTLHYLPRRHVFIQQKPLPNIDNHLSLNKTRKVNEILSRIENGPKPNSSPYSISKQTNLNASYTYTGQYHYAPEIEEREIMENEPEHLDLRLTANEIRNIEIYKKLSPAQFRRKQSSLAKNRVVISVPQYAVHNQVNLNETTRSLHQNVSANQNTARLLSVKPSSNQPDLFSKPNIQETKSLIRLAPRSKSEKSTRNVVKFDDSLDIVEGDFFPDLPSIPDSPTNLNTSFFRTESYLKNDA